MVRVICWRKFSNFKVWISHCWSGWPSHVWYINWRQQMRPKKDLATAKWLMRWLMKFASLFLYIKRYWITFWEKNCTTMLVTIWYQIPNLRWHEWIVSQHGSPVYYLRQLSNKFAINCVTMLGLRISFLTWSWLY